MYHAFEKHLGPRCTRREFLPSADLMLLWNALLQADAQLSWAFRSGSYRTLVGLGFMSAGEEVSVPAPGMPGLTLNRTSLMEDARSGRKVLLRALKDVAESLESTGSDPDKNYYVCVEGLREE